MNGMHRKSTDAIPGTHQMVKHAAAMIAVVAAGAILAAAVLAFFAAFAPSAPASVKAPSWQTRSAATLAADATLARPYWDGRHPRIWTNPKDPMCLAQYHGRHGWATTGSTEFRVECQPLGPQEWAWNEIS